MVPLKAQELIVACPSVMRMSRRDRGGGMVRSWVTHWMHRNGEGNVSRSAYSLLPSILLLVVCPSWGQRSGAPASPSPPTQPGGLGSAPTGSQPVSAGQPRGPHYLDGRILLDTGQPAREPVSVVLNCGTNSLQVIHSDLKGYFRFTFGEGVQSNADYSASNSDTLMSSVSRGVNFPGGLGGFSASGASLTGCELQVSVPGYHPLTK